MSRSRARRTPRSNLTPDPAASLLGSDLHDNPGVGVIVRAGADPRVSHNRFARNATAERSTAWLILDSGANPSFEGNTFDGLRPRCVLPLLKDRKLVHVAATPRPLPSAPESRRPRR